MGPLWPAFSRSGFSTKIEIRGPSGPRSGAMRCCESNAMTRSHLAGILLLAATAARLQAADNLKLKPGLDYMKNAFQGPVIDGDKMWDGLEKGKPNLVFMYGEFCYDAKRQAERTVEMYRDYGDRVHFVVIDLSRPVPKLTQMPLVKKHFTGIFPQTTIFDKNGKVLLDYTGEIDDATLIGWLDAALGSGDNAEQAGTEKAEPQAPASR